MRKVAIGEIDGLKIELENGGYPDPECYVYLNDKQFATVGRSHMHEIDKELLTFWIKETKETVDYEDPGYVIPRIDGSLFINAKQLNTEDFAEKLVNEFFFDSVIDDMHWAKDYKPAVLFKLLTNEAQKRGITLSDKEEWDFESFFSNLYKSTEKGLS